MTQVLEIARLVSELSEHQSGRPRTRSIYGRPLATIDAFAAVNDFAGALGLGRAQIARAA